MSSVATPRSTHAGGSGSAGVGAGAGAGSGTGAGGMNAGRARHLANQRKYGLPLPLLLPQTSSSPWTAPPPPSSPASSSTPTTTSARFNANAKGKGKAPTPSVLSAYIDSFTKSPFSSQSQVEIPICIGEFDPITRSVWIEDERSKEYLFNRGFFGKGSLSRSEPSWKERRVGLLKGGATLAAEQMREQRRLARKQFKIDRAQAMLDAAKQAEAIIASAVGGGAGSSSGTPTLGLPSELAEEVEDGEDEVDNDRPRSGSPTPSTSTVATSAAVDHTTLTAQTFLVRPTRPDQNRNRGRKAFKRRPPPPSTTQADSSTPLPSASAPTPAPVAEPQAEEEEDEDDDLFEESLVEDMEHLQLSLEEAVFLSLGLGVLKVYDPTTQSYTPLGPSLLSLFLTPPSPSPLSGSLSTPTTLLPDDPLLVSYVAYHHFRSIGWVVKDGIKFCCDWLLYRRGPVFSHSAFACVVIPVYDDPQDKISSPCGNEDWYEERMSWKWMNTIMRVNALVQKTVIAVYVTIPSLASFDEKSKLPNGHLDVRKNDLASLLKRYTVREVSMTRFGPSRRRD